MKTLSSFSRIASITVLSVGLLGVTACGTQQAAKDPAVEQARASLTNLQSDSKLATLAPTAIRDAEEAVRAAEGTDPRKEPELTAHLAYLAQNRVEIARAQAATRFAEDQVKPLSDQRERVLLESRTREADRAKARASALEQELADLKQKQTDRGTVFTLSDVLFATGQADLRAGSRANIDRLAQRLNQEPERKIIIEGHTDTTGTVAINEALSQRRADAVRQHLINAGVSSDRINAFGKGQDYPVASNNTAEGRQQNRRVEVILQ